MKRTGELLKSARENRNLSLHEAGLTLKINPKTLQAMEEGDLSKLPSRTFLRGFVKSYGQFLKVDIESLMATFNEEADQEPRPSTPSLEKAPEKVTAPQGKSVAAENERARSLAAQEENQTKQILIAFVLIVSVILFGGIYRLVNKYQKERGSDLAKLDLMKQRDLRPIGPLNDSNIVAAASQALQTINGASVPSTLASNVSVASYSPANVQASIRPTPSAPVTPVSLTVPAVTAPVVVPPAAPTGAVVKPIPSLSSAIQFPLNQIPAVSHPLKVKIQTLPSDPIAKTAGSSASLPTASLLASASSAEPTEHPQEVILEALGAVKSADRDLRENQFNSLILNDPTQYVCQSLVGFTLRKAAYCCFHSTQSGRSLLLGMEPPSTTELFRPSAHGGLVALAGTFF